MLWRSAAIIWSSLFSSRTHLKCIHFNLKLKHFGFKSNCKHQCLDTVITRLWLFSFDPKLLLMCDFQIIVTQHMENVLKQLARRCHNKNCRQIVKYAICTPSTAPYLMNGLWSSINTILNSNVSRMGINSGQKISPQAFTSQKFLFGYIGVFLFSSICLAKTTVRGLALTVK